MKITNNSNMDLNNAELTVPFNEYVIVLQIVDDQNGVWVDEVYKDSVIVSTDDLREDLEDELEDCHFIINEDKTVKVEK